MWYPELDTEKEEFNGKTAEIKIKSGLQVIVMCQCQVLSFVKRTMEIYGVNNQENQVKCIWQLTTLSLQGICKSKNIIKSKSIIKVFSKTMAEILKKQNKKVDVGCCSQERIPQKIKASKRVTYKDKNFAMDLGKFHPGNSSPAL